MAERLTAKNPLEILEIPSSFLKKNEKTILDRIEEAYDLLETQKKEGVKPGEESYPINRCVHLASSVILLASGQNKDIKQSLMKTLKNIEADDAFQGKDPTSVLTTAVLLQLFDIVNAKGGKFTKISSVLREELLAHARDMGMDNNVMVALGVKTEQN